MSSPEPDDIHNRALRANAFPEGYTHPTPAKRYNLVVIGAGPAGLVVAAAAASLGGKVALIERHRMGGDCLNVGCVPSKALISSARAAAAVREAEHFGVGVAAPQVDFPRVMERLRKLRAEISRADSVERFSGLGVDVFLGEGRFTGPDAIEVGSKTLKFARAAITVGSVPFVPEIPGLKEVGFETNLSIFNLTELPESLCVIGGGPIGCELAQSFARLGSQVTLVQRGGRLLPRDDADAAKIVQAKLEADGIRVMLNAKVTAASKLNDRQRQVSVECDGKQMQIPCATILVASGRRTDLSALNLGVANVKSDEHGVIVDDFLRTSNSNVYAAGDCCSGFKFTHAADAMARLLIRNALFLGRGRVSKLVIPWATYTEPEVAHVGLTTVDAAKRGITTDVITVEMRDVDRAVLDHTREGFGRLVLRKGTDEILGATLIGSHAGDMIPIAVLAIQNKLGAGSLASSILPYPTVGEIWRKLGDAYNRTRLTPRSKGVLSAVLRWRRGGD